MKVTQEQFEQIRRWRNVYFSSPDGKKCLCEHLKATGLFNEPEDMEALVAKGDVSCILLGVILLADMGIWTYENFPLLVEAMAGLPLPEIEE